MSFLSQAKTKRLITVHGWSGTVLGLLLYVCLFTGAIVVFEDEIDTWSHGILEHHEDVGHRVDHHFRAAARTVDPAFYEEVRIFRVSEGHLGFLLHTHRKDPETDRVYDWGVRITVDPEDGTVIDRQEGKLEDFASAPGDALRDFWVDLHVALYLPSPYGDVLVGVLGLMMMAAAISGLLIHKNLIRDAFVSARDRARLVGARDLHVLAGTWGLPFAFILAFTGAFFGFAGPVGLPMMAKTAFDGDQLAMIETLVGHNETTDAETAPLASLDYIIADAKQRQDSSISSILINDYNSSAARVYVVLHPSGDALTFTRLAYDGVTRAFLGVKPVLGQVPSAGSSLLGLIRPLHFGDFAGVASKTVWLGMGMAMAFVTASGLLLWTKRRESEPLWRGFQRAVKVIIWGVPFAMLVSATVFFLALPAGDPHFWTPLGFLLAAGFAGTLAVRGAAVDGQLRLATAVLCIALPLLRQFAGGTSWSEALIGGGGEILVIDTLLIAAGLFLLRKARKVARNKGPAPIQAPAE